MILPVLTAAINYRPVILAEEMFPVELQITYLIYRTGREVIVLRRCLQESNFTATNAFQC
jgi:hypothetical protein